MKDNRSSSIITKHSPESLSITQRSWPLAAGAEESDDDESSELSPLDELDDPPSAAQNFDMACSLTDN